MDYPKFIVANQKEESITALVYKGLTHISELLS